MKFLRKYANINIPGNLSSKLRRKRFQVFNDCLKNTEMKNPRILDIGGYSKYWDQLNDYFNSKYSPVLVNISKDWIEDSKYSSIVGDGKSLDFIKDKSFDVAYSNSVIEHMPNFEDQQKMIKNIKRVAKYYFIQTPAFISPLEPHFLFPFFHWLPIKWRVWLVRHFDLGWFKKTKDINGAKNLVESIRILKKKELKSIDIWAKIYFERVILIPKSYIMTNFFEKI